MRITGIQTYTNTYSQPLKRNNNVNFGLMPDNDTAKFMREKGVKPEHIACLKGDPAVTIKHNRAKDTAWAELNMDYVDKSNVRYSYIDADENSHEDPEKKELYGRYTHIEDPYRADVLVDWLRVLAYRENNPMPSGDDDGHQSEEERRRLLDEKLGSAHYI